MFKNTFQNVFYETDPILFMVKAIDHEQNRVRFVENRAPFY